MKPPVVIRPADAAPLDEAEAFLAAHPEIVAFDLILVDANGIARGKIIRRHELLALYRGGRFLPGSILGLDLAGEDVEETGLVWSDGDADRCAWPIAGTLAPLAWTNPPRGQVQVSLYQLDGTPMMADPRHVLQAQAARVTRRGWSTVAAFELEFYLLDREPGPDGRPQAACLPVTGERPGLTQVYGLDALDRLEPFVDAVYRAAEAQALPLETLISEYAAGQYELTLCHRPDVARAADDLAAMKRLLRGVAARHGMVACFMAKPFGDRAGSGMHLHASLADGQGHNLFSDQDGALNPLLLQATAGLLASLDASILLCAPHQNSWRRFASQSYAPTHATWGVNNRSVAVRIPPAGGASRHLEHRMAGIDANPYLVGAVVMAGMLDGIDRALDPGPAISGNGYEANHEAGQASDWGSAIRLAATSPFLREALGSQMLDVYIALRRADQARFAAEVTPLEYRLGLEIV